MSVDEVFRRVRKVYPHVDIATVYRNLHLLSELGLVSEVEMGGRLHCELTNPHEPHHHMMCRVCGRDSALSPQYLEQFHTTLVEEYGFEPDLNHFIVTGVCVECASQLKQPEERARTACGSCSKPPALEA